MSGSRLFLIRHGETAWSRSGQHTSITDLELTDHGVEQAKALSEELEDEEFVLVCSSPRRRALATAALAGFPDPEILDDLAEWFYGDYEGLTTDQIRLDRADWSLFDDGVPGGETAAQVGARADRAIAQARSVGGDVAFFAHGHILRVVAARWCDFDPEDARNFTFDAGRIGVLSYERETPVISEWNR